MEKAASPEERITELVDRYQDTLLKTCYVYLRDREQARDAVQETFLRAYRGLAGYREECGERTWLTRIAVNVCRSQLRGGWFRRVDRRLTPEELPLSAEAGDPDAAVDVMMAVMALPPRLREAVTLYYWQDMTVREIAEAVGAAQSTVSQRLEKARRQLRAALEGREKQ